VAEGGGKVNLGCDPRRDRDGAQAPQNEPECQTTDKVNAGSDHDNGRYKPKGLFMPRYADHWVDKLTPIENLPSEFRLARSRIMCFESKPDGLEGPAVIGRVYFSKSGKTLYYRGLWFKSQKGAGFKANFLETETGEHYWISGPRKDRNDRLNGGNRDVRVDEDVREEYERLIG